MQLSKLLTKLIISKRKMPNTRQGLELMKRSFQRMPTQKSKSFGMSGRKVPKNKDRTMGRFSVVEYGLYHMYIQTSTKAILRNGVTEDDLKLLIQTILHMFDDDMSSVRPSMTVRKVVVVRQNRNSGRVRPTDIEDAMVAKLKPGVNNPTSFNDYDLEFKRDMLPDSVEVKEYTMDNPEGVIL